MSDELDDMDLDADDLAQEGVEAFNAMTTAMQGLDSRMVALDTGLGSKVAKAERAATRAETAAESAVQAAKHAAATAQAGARQTASWAVLGALAGILGAGGAGYWLGHASGRENGLADGYRAARDEKAAASWANTPTGQLALALDRVGSISMLAQCTGQNWKTETRDGRRFCFSMPDAQQSVTGWRIP